MADEYKPYIPNIDQAFTDSKQALQAYYDSIAPAPKLEDLSSYLTDVGSYKPFDWNTAGKQLIEGYQPPQYNQTTYNPYDYNFAESYQAPDEYQPFQFQAPQIDAINSVQPISKEIWDTMKNTQFEDINRQYDDTDTRMRDELIRTGKRPEQASALIANQGIERERAKRQAENAINIQRANQAVDIGTNEQQLNYQRSLEESKFNAQNQERTAQELATKYNLDIEAARYMVEQNANQQKLLADESKSAYDSAASENKYGYEQDLAAEKYKSGINQWIQEQNATEAEKAWQSQYGTAQDVAQTKMSEWQANNAANLDYWNSLLQGQQAASQQAAQQSTYWTNLSSDEKDKEKKASIAPTTTQTTQPTLTKTEPQKTELNLTKPTAPAAPTYKPGGGGYG